MANKKSVCIERRMLSVKEAANYIGVSPATARKFCIDNNLLRRLGGRLIIEKKELDAALDNLPKETY